jgi:hypothetical protein
MEGETPEPSRLLREAHPNRAFFQKWSCIHKCYCSSFSNAPVSIDAQLAFSDHGGSVISSFADGPTPSVSSIKAAACFRIARDVHSYNQ